MARTLTYSQTTGLIIDEAGNRLGKGWAGRGEAKNNPAMQRAKSQGPLPQGTYSVGVWHDHPRLGPMVAELIQTEGETYGRSAFFIHGPASVSSGRYGEESMGCIIVPRVDRLKVKAYGPESIIVVE